MSRHLTRELVAQQAEVRRELLHPVVVDRSFELPRALYIATASLYLGFIAVLGLGLATPGLLIPMAIFAVFIVAGFGLPAVWVSMKPDNAVRQLDWGRFRRQGIATLTGRLTAGEAAAQMLVLPILIFAWGVTCVIIAALV